MERKSILVTLMLLAVVLLAGCSSDDDDVIPSDFNGKWQLLYEEYGDGRRDSVKQGEIVDFTEDKELYHINMREGTLTKNFDYDEWAMYKYQFMENGLKLKLVFVDSKEEIITPLPTEVYQKIK
jgi:major membrane immunogen (membrane-anchored lipoprotein)